MSYRNSNTSQNSDDFRKDSVSEADFGGEPVPEDNKNKRKETKFEKIFRKELKNTGYSSMAGDTSQDSVFLVNKNSKKLKADTKITSLSVFKKPFKDEKRLKDIKETKEETKRNKKVKERSTHGHKENLFGSHLENAVRSFPSNDGVKVPYPIRICLDIIEQKSLDCEQLYRRSMNKSQLEAICDSINSHKIEARLEEMNADPNLACAVVKKFLRELKTPLVSDELLSGMEKCDSAVNEKDTANKIKFLQSQIAKMPQPCLDTFAYLIMHFYRILIGDLNKLEIGMFVQKFQPIFRVRERLFKFMISHADLLFSEFRFKKYRIKSSEEAASRFSMLPDNVDDLEQEISKQEIYLSKLHSKIANEEHSSDKTVQEQLSEELWALQRYVTSLKRKVKKLKLEHKSLESEQLSKLKEMQAKRCDSENHQTERVDPNRLLTSAELYNKELNLICENSVLIESVQQLFEKLEQERLLTAEMQQTVFNLSRNIDAQAPDANQLTAQELVDKELLIISENKLLEERINLINKRINVEKEKIFELKLSIKLKSLAGEQLLAAATASQLDVHLGGKVNLTETKELIMTKL